MQFLAGSLDRDGLLASLYHREYLIEAGEYQPVYPSHQEATSIVSKLLDLNFDVFVERLEQLSSLATKFRHFQLFFLDLLTEEPDDMDNIPHLLSKTKNIRRYNNGRCLMPV